MGLNVASHAFGIHGKDILLDVLADTRLVLFDALGLKFSFAAPGDRTLDVSIAGAEVSYYCARCGCCPFLDFYSHTSHSQVRNPVLLPSRFP